MTFVSDRRHGLEEAVSQVFEESEHAFCFEHLMELFKAELEGLMVEESKDSLIEDFINAAHAFTVEEFDVCVERIRSVSEDLAAWVGNSKPELWSNAFFKGFRYGHLSSSVTELFEDWIPVKEQSSVVQIIDVVRCKIMETIHLRRESSMNWMETALTPSAEQKLQREIAKSRSINVTCLAENVFQVREGEEAVNAVNLETWDCTCRRWKATGLPCKHAIAVFDRTGANAYEFCSKYLTMQCYRLTYSSSLNPIPDVGRPVCPDPVHGKSSLLSRARRLPGRPKGKPMEPKKTSTRKIRCSVCNEVGHNKATCKASPATPTSE
ncbi:hypothetical protein QJS10_CPA10g00485 [Acorus calamus]|uniref:SWIM-type domain-containing protein n=1 Tax=Acorus calamus TaxID=4465 RepID=A0AAV9DZW6_ACOCL|nr:hypothetical protein QJS10_CPA10g00485 [Acorus calamus]